MTTEGTRELISGAREHVPYPEIMDDAKWCIHCADEWPCVTRRLADALAAGVDAVLNRLDELNNCGISYEVYSELHDLVSAIPTAAPDAATEQDECALPGHAGCTRVIVDGEPWFDHFPAETEWEYAWEADEEKRAQMKPRGPRLLIDGQPHDPEEIARFPKGRRMYRTKASPWLPVPGGEGKSDE